MQIGFYAIDKDHENLLCFLQDAGLRALPELVTTDVDPRASSLSEFFAEHGPQSAYLLPEGFAEVEAFYGELPDDPGISKLLTDRSPVIEFQPSNQRGVAVHDGRLFLGTNPSDPRYSVVKRLFDRSARHIRRWTKTDQFGFYVGPLTAEMARNGEIELKHHQITLNPGAHD